MVEMCHCGKPLHYADPALLRAMEEIIRIRGRLLRVTQESSGKSFWVPRHYIALHGLKGSELHTLGFQEAMRRDR